MLKLYAQKLGDISIICVSGGILVGETASLRRIVQLQSDVSMVVLDLARVNRIDAGGLGVLLELRQSLQSKGVAFNLINVTKMIHRVLELTCLDSVFEVGSEVATLTAAAPGRPPRVESLLSPCA